MSIRISADGDLKDKICMGIQQGMKAKRKDVSLKK
jgi:hypothetical protein